MSEPAKVTMMLCSGLRAAEQEKVERLDGPISQYFITNGLSVRICRSRGETSDRLLEFCGAAGVAASVPAAEFLAATDKDAIALIKLDNL